MQAAVSSVIVWADSKQHSIYCTPFSFARTVIRGIDTVKTTLSNSSVLYEISRAWTTILLNGWTGTHLSSVSVRHSGISAHLIPVQIQEWWVMIGWSLYMNFHTFITICIIIIIQYWLAHSFISFHSSCTLSHGISTLPVFKNVIIIYCRLHVA